MIEEIASDFYRIEIPLPEIQLKSINSYVIRDRERNLIIDTGMYNDECLNAMQVALKKLDVDLEKTDFFITHGHMDHIGLVSRLIHAGSVVYINELETLIISKITTEAFLSEIGGFLHMTGFPEKDPEKLFPPYAIRQYKSENTLPFMFVEDTNIIQRGEYRFTCVKTSGHSKGHMCLYEPNKKILVAGDHILEDITPGIHQQLDNEHPLEEYLSSLGKVYALDIDVVLPGHRALFKNAKNRIQDIKEHHHQRNNEVLTILQEGSRSIYEVASQMTWNVYCDSWDAFPVVQSFFATAEAFAHLSYLERRGKIKRTTEGRVATYSLHETY
jgi:glyoxylase-like metal-dependent hydrolase (beta-lactamase superfamily II)